MQCYPTNTEQDEQATPNVLVETLCAHADERASRSPTKRTALPTLHATWSRKWLSLKENSTEEFKRVSRIKQRSSASGSENHGGLTLTILGNELEQGSS